MDRMLTETEKKMITNIRKQHYVWRHYLKPWLIDGKIWCIRALETFNINIDKIAKDDYFYRAESLTENEDMLITSFIENMDPSGRNLLNGIFSIYTKASHGSEFDRNNTIENYHSLIERSAIPLLEKTYNNELSFWENDMDRASFGYYIGMQYTRTKKCRDSTIKTFEALKNHPDNPGDINPLKIGNVLALILAEAIGNWIFSCAEPTIIENDSEIGFLTSDQPVYNLKANEVDLLQPVNEFELFYPIAPQKALIIQEKNKNETKRLDEYNHFIASMAREYIFARSKQDLIRYFHDT